jgi:hypothetical protein
MGLCASDASVTNIVEQFSWQSPIMVDPSAGSTLGICQTGELNAISCPTASLCLAVDRTGDVIVGRLAPPTPVIAGRPAAPTRRSPTRRQIRRLLRAEITPHGKARTIGGLSGRRAFRVTLHLPVAGHVRIRWLVPMPSARHRSHRLLIGHAQAT